MTSGNPSLCCVLGNKNAVHILDHSKAAVKWSNVDINGIVAQSGSQRQRVLTALEYFHEKGWIDLQTKSGVEVFEILNTGFDIDSTAHKLANLFMKKEKKDIERLHTMIEMFEKDLCLAKSLSAYFGAKLDAGCCRLEAYPYKVVEKWVQSQCKG